MAAVMPQGATAFLIDITSSAFPQRTNVFSGVTGSIRNSNNTGGINPFTDVEMNATIGDEYITNLFFSPSSFTLVAPEPSTACLLGPGLAEMARRSRL